MYHTLHIYAYHMIDLTFSLLQNKKHAHHIKDIKSHTHTHKLKEYVRKFYAR